MRVLGVDISRYQPPNLPWALWRAFGVRFAIIRASIGYLGDNGYDRHRALAQAAGVETALYHTLLTHDAEIAYFDPARAARTFWQLHQPGDERPMAIDGTVLPRSWVDVEALGINASHLAAFLAEFERVAPGVLIGIYTSRYFWQEIGERGLIGKGHTEFARYPFWIADYSADPPRLPDVCQRADVFQWRFKRGYLPGYDADLDVNWIETGEQESDMVTVAQLTKHLSEMLKDVAENDHLYDYHPPIVASDNWWEVLPMPIKLAPTGKVVPFYNADGTRRTVAPTERALPTPGAADSQLWRAFERKDDLLRVTNFPAGGQWWAKAADLKPAAAG